MEGVLLLFRCPDFLWMYLGGWYLGLILVVWLNIKKVIHFLCFPDYWDKGVLKRFPKESRLIDSLDCFPCFNFVEFCHDLHFFLLCLSLDWFVFVLQNFWVASLSRLFVIFLNFFVKTLEAMNFILRTDSNVSQGFCFHFHFVPVFIFPFLMSSLTHSPFSN